MFSDCPGDTTGCMSVKSRLVSDRGCGDPLGVHLLTPNMAFVSEEATLPHKLSHCCSSFKLGQRFKISRI